MIVSREILHSFDDFSGGLFRYVADGSSQVEVNMSLTFDRARTTSLRRKTASAERSPGFKAFKRDRVLPSGVLGPVDFSHGLTLRAEDFSEAIPSGVSW